MTDESDGSELVRYDYISHGDEQRLRDVQTRFNGALHYTYTEQGWLSSWRDNGPTHFHLRYDDEGRVTATGTQEGLYNDTFRYFPDSAEPIIPTPPEPPPRCGSMNPGC
ncbi:hypothetical protein [Escherichia coli]|uniref:hypothetical protein n=1 Tax=Escherichia coli TaxID=562 RepID=UPI00201A4881|nr:hypothetical protein [Escherichia coli]